MRFLLFMFQLQMQFDEALVLRQLRYTGMLQTVRIRRSGYGAKYTFQVQTVRMSEALLKKLSFDFGRHTGPTLIIA